MQFVLPSLNSIILGDEDDEENEGLQLHLQQKQQQHQPQYQGSKSSSSFPTQNQKLPNFDEEPKLSPAVLNAVSSFHDNPLLFSCFCYRWLPKCQQKNAKFEHLMLSSSSSRNSQSSGAAGAMRKSRSQPCHVLTKATGHVVFAIGQKGLYLLPKERLPVQDIAEVIVHEKCGSAAIQAGGSPLFEFRMIASSAASSSSNSSSYSSATGGGGSGGTGGQQQQNQQNPSFDLGTGIAPVYFSRFLSFPGEYVAARAMSCLRIVAPDLSILTHVTTWPVPASQFARSLSPHHHHPHSQRQNQNASNTHSHFDDDNNDNERNQQNSTKRYMMALNRGKQTTTTATAASNSFNEDFDIISDDELFSLNELGVGSTNSAEVWSEVQNAQEMVGNNNQQRFQSQRPRSAATTWKKAAEKENHQQRTQQQQQEQQKRSTTEDARKRWQQLRAKNQTSSSQASASNNNAGSGGGGENNAGSGVGRKPDGWAEIVAAAASKSPAKRKQMMQFHDHDEGAEIAKLAHLQADGIEQNLVAMSSEIDDFLNKFGSISTREAGTYLSPLSS